MSNSFSASYSIGGVIDEVKNINKISKIEEIGRLSAFPEFTQPYNEMVKVNIAAIKKSYNISFKLPEEDVEILGVTLTCSGYGEGDYFNMWCNKNQWFKNWYTNELKEGLFLGTSTFVYKARANSVIDVEFVNESGTSKTIWIGFRMLKKEKKDE